MPRKASENRQIFSNHFTSGKEVFKIDVFFPGQIGKDNGTMQDTGNGVSSKMKTNKQDTFCKNIHRRLLPAALAAALLLIAPAAEYLPVTEESSLRSGSFGLFRDSLTADAAPESWYLNDYEFYRDLTLEEANAAYQELRRAEISQEATPEENMLIAADYLRRLCYLPPLKEATTEDPSALSDGIEVKGYTPVGAVLRMPGEGYTPGKWLNYDRLGRDFLSYQVTEAHFAFSEDENGLTLASCRIRDPHYIPEEETGSSDSEETGTEEADTEETEETTIEETETEEDGNTKTEEEETGTDTETEEEYEPIPLPFYPYPSAGYFPTNLISAKTTAWSVELNSDHIKAPDPVSQSKLQVIIRDLVTGDTFTRTVSDGTLEIHTTLSGTKMLMFAPPESSIFDSNFGDLAGFRVTVKGLSDPDGFPIRNPEWQTIFFQPKSEQYLHLLSVAPEQNRVRFAKGSIAPENLKLFTAFLPVNALCTTRESAFLVPLGGWEADAEDFAWRTHPNLAAFSSSPIYESLDNPNMLKKRISLPFTFSEDLPLLSVTTTRIARGEDFFFVLSPASEEADYRLYQIRENEGKPAISLWAARNYPTDGIVTFPMPKMEHDHKGIYFAVISEKDRLTFSNFVLLDPDENTGRSVTLPEGMIAMGLMKEEDFRSDVFENHVPTEPETEEETPFETIEHAFGRGEKPIDPDDTPFIEAIYRKTLSWMSGHKGILYGAAGVLVFLTVVMTLLQIREQRTYRDPSSIKIRKKPEKKDRPQEKLPTEETEQKRSDLSVEDLDR